jgi:nitroreductase
MAEKASRRGILKLLGGGVVLAAVGAGGWYAANGPSPAARTAWKEAGAPEEKRRRFLSYALLAPNPHNLQPWLVKLEGEDALTLYHDPERRLPATDPFDRQITLGCGAFLELFAIAAAQEKFSVEITPFPEGASSTLDRRPVAHVRLTAGLAQPDPSFGFVLARRTNRNTYDDREVAPDLRKQLEAAGGVHGAVARTTGEGDLAAKLRDLTWRAHQKEMLTPATCKENADWMRIGNSAVVQHRDGLSMDGQMMEFAKLAGMMTHASMADTTSEAFKIGMKQFEEKATSARAFAWLTAPEGKTSELAAGRAYMRLALKAQELGLAIHPWSQSLQEYPEMADLYREVHDLIGAGQRIQMLVRVGYAAPVVAAPRRGLDALMTS